MERTLPSGCSKVVYGRNVRYDLFMYVHVAHSLSHDCMISNSVCMQVADICSDVTGLGGRSDDVGVQVESVPFPHPFPCLAQLFLR